MSQNNSKESLCPLLTNWSQPGAGDCSIRVVTTTNANVSERKISHGRGGAGNIRTLAIY